MRDYGRHEKSTVVNSLFVPGPVLYGRFIGRSGLLAAAAINRLLLEGLRQPMDTIDQEITVPATRRDSDVSELGEFVETGVVDVPFLGQYSAIWINR